jgi:uncharacterized delta-60 repeat protein
MKRIKWILAFAAMALILPSPCYAQWARVYDGSGEDVAQSIQQTTDSGFVVAGWTESFGAGGRDSWVSKLDSDGNVGPSYPGTWQKTYDGSGEDVAQSIQQTTDSGFVVVGWTESFGAGGRDSWVSKLDSDGTVVWQKTYGGSGEDVAQSIHQTFDNGYVVSGYSDSFQGKGHTWVLKLHADGSVAWENTYSGPAGDEGTRFVQEIFDQLGSPDGYIVADGRGDAPGWDDIAVLRLNSDGTKVWQKAYRGSDVDTACAIRQTSDSGYIVAGDTKSFGAGNEDFWVLKLNNDGSVAWGKAYGGSDVDTAYAIQQTSDGGFVVAGKTRSFGEGNEDFWVLKLTSSGAIVWQKTYGGTGVDIASSVYEISDGGYVVAGKSTSFGADNEDVLILTLDENGEIPGCSGMGTSAAVVSDALPDVYSITAWDPPFPTSAVINDIGWEPEPTDPETTECCSFSPPCECGVVPDATVIPRGGTLGFQASVTNNTDLSGHVYFATKVKLPSGSMYPPSGFFDGPYKLWMNPHGSISGHLSHNTSGWPLGTYIYRGLVGIPGAALFDKCEFEFEVIE